MICKMHIITYKIMQTLFDFWFPTDFYQSFWFDESKDKQIFELFKEDLESAEILDLSFILNQNFETQYYYLILFDQITRNIARYENSNEFRNDFSAVEIAKNLINYKYDLKIPFIKKIFILLPLRHTNKIENLNFVIEKLDEYHVNICESEKKDYQRFYIASLKSYTWCYDDIEIQTNSENIPIYNSEIHDDNCKDYKNIVDIFSKDNSKIKLYQSLINYCKKYKVKNIGVSLSGGVDSMVLLFLLKQMEINKQINKVVAIHIDYNWRKESNIEASFLLNFCSKIQVDFILRNVKHYNAKVDTKIDIERETVEEETKQIRFNTYKFATKKYDLDGICLGHHKDDLIENVFMNLSKSKNILDLFVTEEYSLQNDVYIMRPMLGHHKTDVFEVAHNNNILYFKDTTPDWSFRGTMRRKIFPTMEAFDKMILDNFYKIGVQSQEWGSFIKNKIISPILNKSKTYDYGYSLELLFDFQDIPISFWTEIFVGFFHNRGIKMISQKNLKAFHIWINLNQDSLFRLSNGFICYKLEKELYFLKTELYEKMRFDLTQEKKYIHPIQIAQYIMQKN
jgi:tRNA(Ile)-lysidine synthetase-like protein